MNEHLCINDASCLACGISIDSGLFYCDRCRRIEFNTRSQQFTTVYIVKDGIYKILKRCDVCGFVMELHEKRHKTKYCDVCRSNEKYAEKKKTKVKYITRKQKAELEKQKAEFEKKCKEDYANRVLYWFCNQSKKITDISETIIMHNSGLSLSKIAADKKTTPQNLSLKIKKYSF